MNIVEHLYDNPSAIPKRMLAKLLYGHDSVFARTPTAAQVAALTRRDVAEHLTRWQRPDTAVLGIAGAATHIGQPLINLLHKLSAGDVGFRV